MRVNRLWIISITLVSLSTATRLSYTVPEEKAAGYKVGNVITDADFEQRYAADGGIPAILRFSLLGHSEYFTVHSVSSDITTSNRLDREVICADEPDEPCVLEIDVVVNPNTPEHFQMIKVQVTLMDVNDNSPMFSMQTKDIFIPEDVDVETKFYLPIAEDRDSQRYGVAQYELEAHTQMFRISSEASPYGGTDLYLVVIRQLDRELQGSYTLKLVARDSGSPPRSGMMLLNVTVGDENDNAPTFQQPLYNVRVPESAQPGIMLTRVMATDRDTGDNSKLIYSISMRTSSKIRRIFSMDQSTGELFLRQRLDYETDKQFIIPIVAIDSSTMPRRSQAVVNVSIADENDNHPIITVTTVTNRAQVIEHSPNGTFVAHVRVRDDDSGSNGLVTCVISSPYFLLQNSYEDEFNLVVDAVLDREEHTELNVTILCSDGGSPQKVSRYYLQVHIVDVNDQMPTFDRFVYYTMPILENNAPGIPITQVKAMDKDVDTNAEIQFRLGSESDANYFSVDKITGIITARARLDREHQREYTFSVLAVDKGDPPLTATAAVYIRLADVNDNKPVFNKSYYRMSVAENMPKYSFVGKVLAQDPDEGANGDVWYRMVNASSGPFIIAHDTGIISTRVPLDREKIGGSQYQVTVVATDYGTPALSSEVKITIDVVDENDNPPIITSTENMTLTCSYQTPVNTTIGSVKAFDPDAGENGKLGYFIQSGNQYNMFGIEKSTGDIKVLMSIDPSMVGYYRLGVGVHDNGQPPHTVLSNIAIHITKEAYVPVSLLRGRDPNEPAEARTYNVNLIVVVVLSSMSGVLSIILIVAIIRIKRQNKENHSYNCRTEAQKLFNQSGRSSEQSHHTCVSSWGDTTTTADRNSVFSSHESTVSQHEPEVLIPPAQNILTTFTSNTNNNNRHVMTALQSFDATALQKPSDKTAKPVNTTLHNQRLQRAKEPDSDSGNCEDVCSIHNSTPLHTTSELPPSNNPNTSAPGGAHQPFHYKFLSTAALGDESSSKVPSSISSGNNSMNTTPSHQGSPAVINTNSIANYNHVDGSVVSGHAAKEGAVNSAILKGRHDLPPPQESNSDTYPLQNTSQMSDQTINGDRLCERIDDLFFGSDVV